MIDKERFVNQIDGLLEDYDKAKQLYDKAITTKHGELRREALSQMADALQLQKLAIENYGNFLHVVRTYESTE